MIYSFDGHTPKIGEGAYISETAIVIGDVEIGAHSYVGHGVILRGDYGRIEIGEECAVEEGVIVHAPPNDVCKIGKRVTLGHGAIIHSKEIEPFVVIGMGAVTSLGTVIGEYSIVAEGAVVKMNDKISPRVVVAGSPAKVVRPVLERDINLWSQGKQLYVDLAAKYLKIGMHKID